MAEQIVRKNKDGTPANVHEAAGEVLRQVFKAKSLLTSVGKDIENATELQDRWYYSIESIVELLEDATTRLTCDVLKDNARAKDVIGEVSNA